MEWQVCMASGRPAGHSCKAHIQKGGWRQLSIWAGTSHVENGNAGDLVT